MKSYFLIVGGMLLAIGVNSFIESKSKPIVDLDKYHKEEFNNAVFNLVGSGLVLGIGLYFLEK